MVRAYGQRDRRTVTPWGIRLFPFFCPSSTSGDPASPFGSPPPRELINGMDTEKEGGRRDSDASTLL